MTIPEHLIDTVYLGDVFELMRQLPDQSVDMVFSDPDYNVGVRYNGKSYTRSFEEYIEWYIELARESLRVLKDDGNMFFHQLSQAERLPACALSGRGVLRCAGLCVGLQYECGAQPEAVHDRPP
jgi:predicted methyltransferase